MLRLWQHTLLAIVVGLRGASDNTLCWVLLWVMRGFGQHTLLGIIRSDVGCLPQWVQNNPLKKIIYSRKVEVSVSVSPPKLLKRISPHKQNHMALLYKRATIRQIPIRQNPAAKDIVHAHHLLLI
jgi:hypothetical protein